MKTLVRNNAAAAGSSSRFQARPGTERDLIPSVSAGAAVLHHLQIRPHGRPADRFENYSPRRGILGSEWVGFKHFVSFLQNPYFWRLLRNTLWISVSNLIFAFPAPIILALMLNELKSKQFQRKIQLIAYLPHFVSMIVVCGWC